MNRKQKEITVLGAGIVGISCAINLQRLGFIVTVVDQQEPGEGCSFGNAGMIAPCAMIPINSPELLTKAPAMLLDPLGPIAIRWRYLPKMLSWQFKFLQNCKTSKVEQITDGLSELTSGALEEHQRLAANGAGATWIRPSPYLYIYESAAALASEEFQWRLRRDRGITTRVLHGNEVQEFEPAIDSRYQCAVVMEDGHGFSPDPSQLVKALASQFQSDGGRFIQADVQQVEIVNQKPNSLITSEGSLALQRLVIAAGAFSGKFATQLGESVPLLAERGYHITLKDSGITPRCPIMNSAGKFVTTPMNPGLRFAGLAEFSGLTEKPNYHFAKRLLAHAKIMFPKINLDDFTEWMGNRPSLPDSLPVIGQSSNFEQIFYAFGHHHVGLLSGPKTGRILAEFIAGQKPSIDLSPYSIQRFIKK